MHHSIWKIIFVLGAYEYLERLEGKIRKCLFFMLKYYKVTVCFDKFLTDYFFIFFGQNFENGADGIRNLQDFQKEVWPELNWQKQPKITDIIKS